MSNEIYTIEQLKFLLYPVLQNFGVKRAILFGSYGKGIAHKDSDIDLVVDSNLRGLKFVGLLEAVRSVLDKEIDLFDVTHIEKHSEIEEEIKKTGVVFYEK